MKNKEKENINISESLDQFIELQEQEEENKDISKKINFKFDLSKFKLDKNKKPKKKELLFIIIPTLLVATAVIVYLFISQVANTYKLDETFVQYYNGGTYVINKGSTLVKNSENEVVLKTESNTNEMSSLVFYAKDSNKIVIPQNMIYYDGQGIDYYLVPAFTEIIFESNKSLLLKHESKEVSINGGFMYDGEDYYLFLEPVTITYNGYVKKLGAYSYVEVLDGYTIYGYNYSTGDSFEAEADSDIIVTSDSGFKASLRSDSLETSQNYKLLLFSRPELLDKIWERD